MTAWFNSCEPYRKKTVTQENDPKDNTKQLCMCVCGCVCVCERGGEHKGTKGEGEGQWDSRVDREGQAPVLRIDEGNRHLRQATHDSTPLPLF